MPGKTVLTVEERRAKRAERREKQRAANIGRAQKMHKERLTFEKQGRPMAESQPPLVNIGCSGWYYWHWQDHFYADKLRKDWFPHYAAHFSTVELNAPFYSWPTMATVKTWIKQAASPQFLYTVKVSELITHIKKFKGTKQLVKDFGLIADLLGAQMGCLLYQLPPSYHYTPARLRDLLGQLDHRRRNVVEFRHKSWWNTDVYKAFRKTKTIFCSSSAPRLPDELIKTSDEVYIRFHGTKTWYRHDYTTEELAIWVDRIRKSKAKRVWAYFNNDREGFSIRNARELLRLLSTE